MVFEPTCLALCCWGAGCLSGVRTFLPGTVEQGCRLFKQCRNLPTGTVLQGCRLLKRCRNICGGHFVAVVQAVLVLLVPSCCALCCKGAGCLSGVGTYLPGTVVQGCKLFK